MLWTVLLFIGVILSVIGWGMILIAAFRESFLWGIGSLLIPLVGLIFVFTHWQETKNGFFYSLVGAVLIAAGSMMSANARTNSAAGPSHELRTKLVHRIRSIPRTSPRSSCTRRIASSVPLMYGAAPVPPS